MPVDFTNILGPPCQTVIDAVKNDPDLADKYRLREERVQRALRLVGPRPYEVDFPLPGPGSREIQGVLTTAKIAGCIVSIYKKPPGSHPSTRLWSYHEAVNRYIIKIAVIECFDNPPFIYKTAIQDFTFRAKLPNKIITKTTNDFYYKVKCEDNNHSVSINKKIQNNKIDFKLFECPINNDEWYTILSNDTTTDKPATFELKATVNYTIFYPTGGWSIDFDDSTLEIKITNSIDDTNDYSAPTSLRKESFVNFRARSGYVGVVDIPARINDLYKKWIRFNKYTDEKRLKELLYGEKIKTDTKTINCHDDCDRSLQICILKKSTITNFIKTDPYLIYRDNQLNIKPNSCKLI